MRIWNLRTLALLGALAMAAGAAVLAGCESRPAEPVFDSPWDPDGPDGGDALAVTAFAGDSTITVSWNQPQGQGIETYLVGHTLDPGGAWEDLAEVPATASANGIYTYQDPAPTAIHYFRVQAFTATEYSIVGYGRTGTAFTPPRVVPATGGRNRASRYLDLLITVGEGDSLRIADNDSFGGAVTIAAAAPGEVLTLPWDLGVGPDGTVFEFHCKTVDATGYGSPAASLDFVADFGPQHYVAGRPATLASRTVDIVVPSTGLTGMKFALSEEELAGAAWIAPADTVHDFLLGESIDQQTIHAEFAGDFGYHMTYVRTVTPDDLADASFTLAAPPSGVIETGTVLAISDATATLMRFAENGAFSGVPWQAYADTAEITLSAGEGRKVVYAQYRNDWTDSAVLTDYVDVVAQPVAVSFLAPADGALFAGGVSLQVRGSALAGSAADAVDSVKVDLGDGAGWRTPSGLESWSLMWDVPEVTEETAVALRARAWITDSATSAVDSATALISVTVQPPVAP
jgi:hypothetical protein